jgi:biopolymer transport protein ExbB/TolQ
MFFTGVSKVVAFQEPEAPAEKKEQPAAEAKEGDGKAAAAGNTSLFMHIIRSAGWIFGPMLLIISIGLIALVCLLAMELRMTIAIPPTFVEEFTDLVNKKQFKQAFDMAKDDSSFLGKVMSQGMSRLQYGIEDSRESAMNMVDSIKASKEQSITYLATIGTLGPMLGLVGTVFGMILSFMELGRPGTTPRPDKLADGSYLARYRSFCARNFLPCFFQKQVDPHCYGYKLDFRRSSHTNVSQQQKASGCCAGSGCSKCFQS